MTQQIEINLDSTALSSSACILELIRVLIGELPSQEPLPEGVLSNKVDVTKIGAYREKVMNIELVYGIAVHAFLDTMFKTGGHYPTARVVAEKSLQLPNNPNKNKPWMNDPKHLISTCFNVWTNYVEEEKTFDIIKILQKCYWCKGEGTIILKDNTITFCKYCSGKKMVEGPATEITFSIPYFSNNYIKVNLCGTIDTVGRFKGGCNAIRDWKTTGAWDNEGYFEQYELSRQLRFYNFALRLMAEHYPNSVLGQIGKTNPGTFIDGIFLSSNANEVTCSRSDVYTYTEKEIIAFRRLLDNKIEEISNAVMTGDLPKQGILNGSCEKKFGKCKFWHVCKNNDTVATVLLNRDYIRKIYDPLKFNQ